MRDRAIVTACLVAFAALCSYCLTVHLPRLEARAAARAAASILPELQARWSDHGRGGLRLTGLVGNGDVRLALGERLQQRVEGGYVANDVIVGTRAVDAAWEAAAVDVVDAARRVLPHGFIGIDGQRVTVRGDVAGDEARRAVMVTLQGAAGDRFRFAEQFSLARPATLATLESELRRAAETHVIAFESSSAQLAPEGHDAVAALAAVLLRSTLPIEIGGHTDASGNAEANARLSLARAQAVRDALVALGIDEARLVPIGHGASRPVADNTTDEGRRLNRRIEFTVRSLRPTP